MARVRNHFRPEFLNRIDEFIVFEPLSAAQIGRVVELRAAGLANRVAERRMTLRLGPGALRCGLRHAWAFKPCCHACAPGMIAMRPSVYSTACTAYTARGWVRSAAAAAAVNRAAAPALWLACMVVHAADWRQRATTPSMARGRSSGHCSVSWRPRWLGPSWQAFSR